MKINSQTLDHTVERLHVEFGAGHSRTAIARMVRKCVEDLAGSPHGAMPELAERLARQRLLGAETGQPVAV